MVWKRIMAFWLKNGYLLFLHRKNMKGEAKLKKPRIMNNQRTTMRNQVPNINSNNVVVVIQCFDILSPINTIVKPRFWSPSLSSFGRNPSVFLSVSVFKHHSGLDSRRKVLFFFCQWFNDWKGKFNLTNFFHSSSSLTILNCFPLTTMAVFLDGFEDSHGL